MKPVLFLVYKRIDLVKQVFESIKAYKPERLYIGADGPKNEIDQQRCLVVRDYIISQIDWDCSVQTLFRSENLGSSLAVSSAITWFFEHEEEGIILEDDCCPSQSFFTYCEQMLDFYRDSPEVMQISGCNGYGNLPLKDPYFFSKFPICWGWATWRRAWQKFDLSMNHLDASNYKEFFWNHFSQDYNQYVYWLTIYENVIQCKYDCWDYQWWFSIWKNNGITINTKENFIKNIGFSLDALHTKNINSPLGNLQTWENFEPTSKLKKIKINRKIDNLIFYYLFREEYGSTIHTVKKKRIRIKNNLVKDLLKNKISVKDFLYIAKTRIFKS